MKYKIKNFERTIRGLFKNQIDFEVTLQLECDKQFNDSFDFILFDIGSDESVTGYSIEIKILKSDIEKIPEYNPNGWNKYPLIKPPKEGNYLVTDEVGCVSVYHYCDYEFPNVDHMVVAFRALPEPYKE